MELKLKARDFTNTRFDEPKQCAIAKAANRTFKAKNAAEAVFYLEVAGKKFGHLPYGGDQYREDKATITWWKRLFNTTIRTISLRQM